MLVKEWLEQNEVSADELADRLGLKASSVIRRVRAKDEQAEMPLRWLRQLDGAQDEGPPSNGVLMDDGRVTETPPSKPAGASVRKPEQAAVVDMSTVAGYIEGAYTLAAHTIEGTDPALAAAVAGHAKQAGDAWAKWIESEPKVKALLERMMVGTPLGEVIGVHVGIGFAYFMSRSAYKKAIEDAAAAAAEQYARDHPEETGVMSEARV